MLVAEAHADPDAGHHVSDLLHYTDIVLLPQMTVKEAIALFENAESDALAVVDGPDTRHVIGLLTEHYALRRYTTSWSGGGGSCPGSSGRKDAPSALREGVGGRGQAKQPGRVE